MGNFNTHLITKQLCSILGHLADPFMYVYQVHYLLPAVYLKLVKSKEFVFNTVHSLRLANTVTPPTLLGAFHVNARNS
jgi:hypothetical protein